MKLIQELGVFGLYTAESFTDLRRYLAEGILETRFLRDEEVTRLLAENDYLRSKQLATFQLTKIHPLGIKGRMFFCGSEYETIVFGNQIPKNILIPLCKARP